jgi:glucose-1-phosphate thymidylyltransferase
MSDVYPRQGKLHVDLLGRGFAWEGAGRHDSLMDAGELIRPFEQREGFRIDCLKEIAFENGWIDRAELVKQAPVQVTSEYGRFLRGLAMAGQDKPTKRSNSPPR